MGGQAVPEALCSLFLALAASATPDTGGVGHGNLRARAPGACIDTGCAADRLHGAQGLVVGGEAGAGAEASIVQEEGKGPRLRFEMKAAAFLEAPEQRCSPQQQRSRHRGLFCSSPPRQVAKEATASFSFFLF